MYREQWVQDALGERSLLQCALDVHMTHTGSYPRYDSESFDMDVAALRWSVLNWKSDSLSPDFDNAVYNLLVTTLRECDV